MIIARYLLKEILATMMGVGVVLLLIAISVQMVGLLGKVTAGVLQTNTLLIIVGLSIFDLLVFILPLALYLGILLALSRLYRDSEMTAIAASGIGTAYVLKTVLVVGLIFALFQGGLTLYLSPWAETHYARLTEKSKKSTDIEGVIPGRFNELSEGKGVVYAQEIDSGKGELRNIFLQMENNQNQEKGPATIVARRAYKYQDQNTGDQFLLLEDGSRYEGFPGDENFTMIEFKQHGIRIEEKPVVITQYRHKGIPTQALLASDDVTYIAELQWRISSALFCIGLALLAVPLSKTSQRQGRYGKLALAIIIYMLLSNLLNVARSWVHNGVVQPELGMWWVQGVVVLLIIVLVLQQTGIKHLLVKRQASA